ncbi:hypothetical protein FVEG_05829 [Fusarium verticillioides 7600]|uniref:Myb-like domain-containing protein n=1 Tax=Gibberella moniliformis (strain M3125 / FGSC 7600) TaxID=334819 RepID=W7LZV0_GIBM7|nr:hypothetical protein FVEG_05829 [Fusarium verticillioides 7600]EWG44858.1 hypothetical protein FVEG_05829 [Fusarium verticillioides 7600]
MAGRKRKTVLKSPKGKECARSNIIYFDESPDEDGPSNSASKGTNMASATTGKASEASSSKAGSQNPFSPFSLSIGPRPRAQPQPQLPIFSSGDFPQAEARSLPSNDVNNENTAPQPPQDIRKRSFTTSEKCQAIEMCLSVKEEYVAMTAAPNYDQAPFWTKVLNEKLDINLASKFKNWKNLRECVECWCMVRRALLREGRLPAVSQGQPELDTLVDSWNKVFAQRFCTMYRGYFESATVSQLPIRSAVPSPMASSNQNALPEPNETVTGRKRKSVEPVPRITPTHDSPHLGRGTPNRNVFDNQPKRQRQRSPSRGPPVLRTSGRPSSPTQGQSRSAGSFSRGHDSQYPDTWVANRDTNRRLQPRGFREDTVEFDNMSTRRQNQLIRTQNRTLLERIEDLEPRSEEGLPIGRRMRR